MKMHFKNTLGGSSGTINFQIHPRRTLIFTCEHYLSFARYPDVKLIPYGRNPLSR